MMLYIVKAHHCRQAKIRFVIIQRFPLFDKSNYPHGVKKERLV